MTHTLHAPSSHKPLRQISKPILHPEFIAREMPFKKKGEKKEPPLIAHIKNNEEVQSYPSTEAPALPFGESGAILKVEAEGLCCANYV